MAMPAQIDQPASRGVKSSGTSTWEVSKTAEANGGCGEDGDGREEDAEDGIRDDKGR